MAKFIADYVLDASCDAVAEGTKLTVCETQPATYADATTAKGSGGVMLGEVALTAGDGNGDFTVGDGDTSGRKVTVGAQAVPITVDGARDHVAIVDVANTRLLAVTTITSRALVNGDTDNLNAFDPFENADGA